MDGVHVLPGDKLTPVQAHFTSIAQAVRDTMAHSPRLLQLEGLPPTTGDLYTRTYVLEALCAIVGHEVLLPMDRATDEGQLQPSKNAARALARGLQALVA